MKRWIHVRITHMDTPNSFGQFFTWNFISPGILYTKDADIANSYLVDDPEATKVVNAALNLLSKINNDASAIQLLLYLGWEPYSHGKTEMGFDRTWFKISYEGP